MARISIKTLKAHLDNETIVKLLLAEENERLLLKREQARIRKRNQRSRHALQRDTVQSAPISQSLPESPQLTNGQIVEQNQQSGHEKERDLFGHFPVRDIRKDLFDHGIPAIVRMTGKTPDSARALIGRWLALVNDEAVQVIGLIEDAARNNIADATGWIEGQLRGRQRNGKGKPTLSEVCDNLMAELDNYDDNLTKKPPATSHPPRQTAFRLLSPK